jgi:hypothetical protein
MKKLFLLFVLFPILLQAVEPEEKIEDFFDNMEAGSYARAIDYFFAGNKRMTTEHLNGMKSQVGNHLGANGAFHSFELVGKEKLTSYFHIYTYLVRYERELVYVELYLYKPKDRWMGTICWFMEMRTRYVNIFTVIS